jgi:hypothetical protein
VIGAFFTGGKAHYIFSAAKCYIMMKSGHITRENMDLEEFQVRNHRQYYIDVLTVREVIGSENPKDLEGYEVTCS